jgi:hypothetical protein
MTHGIVAIQVQQPGQAETVTWSLDGIRRIIIGRGQQADIRIDDPGIDPQHVEIYCVNLIQGPAYYIHDLASHNGTRVGGENVSNVRVKPDNLIHIGASTLMVIQCDASQAQAIPPRRPALRAEARGDLPMMGPVLIAPAPASDKTEEGRRAMEELRREMEAAQSVIAELQEEITRLCEEHARHVERIEVERDMACLELEKMTRLLTESLPPQTGQTAIIAKKPLKK